MTRRYALILEALRQPGPTRGGWTRRDLRRYLSEHGDWTEDPTAAIRELRQKGYVIDCDKTPPATYRLCSEPLTIRTDAQRNGLLFGEGA